MSSSVVQDSSDPATVPRSHVEKTRALLRENFLADRRPWVVAYSGGKDSTLVLQLVYEMLSDIPNNFLKPVHIICSDTGVEPPNIAAYMRDSLYKIAVHALRGRFDIVTHLIKPPLENGFWSNLIGKGYPPPTRWFRWCTSKMKIKPSKKIIEQLAGEAGSVILLLGTRISESSERGKQMNAREYNARGLNPHHQLADTLVFSPIAHWTTDQVWEYLFTNNPPPWGGSHDKMMGLYRQANAGECPLVMDLNTPSCGGSRFGCWTCTVVKVDKSMESFIENGEEWMLPLNEFRNWLKEIREDESRRNPYRRNGEPGLGPFNSQSRKEILERLLRTEQQVGLELISDAELLHIQEEWTGEFDVMRSALRLALQFGRSPMKNKTRMEQTESVA